jgi:hypothetical protein
MFDFLQKLFPWLVGLPLAAKSLVSLAIILVAVAFVVLIWTKPKEPITATTPSANLGSQSPTALPEVHHASSPLPSSNTTPPQESGAKATPPPRASTEEMMWPVQKTIDGLKRRLDDLSKGNSQVLLEVARAGKRGVYMADLEHKTRLSTRELDSRLGQLAQWQLIEQRPQTVPNFRLSRDIASLLDNDIALLETLLK